MIWPFDYWYTCMGWTGSTSARAEEDIISGQTFFFFTTVEDFQLLDLCYRVGTKIAKMY